MAGRRVHFVMPDKLVERIDAACPEGVSRGEFVRRAVEQALEETSMTPGRRASPGIETPAPAERSDEPKYVPRSVHRALANAAVRDSAQAKRDVRPIPKKGAR